MGTGFLINEQLPLYPSSHIITHTLHLPLAGTGHGSFATDILKIQYQQPKSIIIELYIKCQMNWFYIGPFCIAHCPLPSGIVCSISSMLDMAPGNTRARQNQTRSAVRTAPHPHRSRTALAPQPATARAIRYSISPSSLSRVPSRYGELE